MSLLCSFLPGLLGLDANLPLHLWKPSELIEKTYPAEQLGL